MLSYITRIRTTSTLRLHFNTSYRSISKMSVSEFIAAAEQADPSLKGEGKAQTEIQQVAGEVEALAKDVAVSMLNKCRCSCEPI